MEGDEEFAESIIIGESSLQRNVISQCKQEMISSIVIGVFVAVIGTGSLIYAATIEEPEDGLKLLANISGIAFMIITFLFLLRTVFRGLLLNAAKEKHVTKLLWTVVAVTILDIVIMLICLLVILWTGVLKWLILLGFSVIVDVWRLKTQIQFLMECKKGSAVV